MRLPCVPILFAVAIRPVAVGAHAEPSDIVTSDGQFEVQRRLRVQERAHDKDDYERTSPLVEEIISSAEKIEPAITNSHPLESASDTSNTLKRPTDILESENRPTKIRKTMVNDFLAKANKEKSLTMPTKKDSTDDFILFGLQNAEDKLFEQPQLVYWVHYIDALNEANMPTPLLNRLLKFYNVGDLAKAAVKVPNDEIALRVLKEIEADFLFRKYSPDDAFTKLRLEEDGDKLFDNRLFHFWTKYVIYYNSWVKQEADKVSMLSVLEKHFDQLTLLDQINIKQNSKITEHLMEELKGINMEDLAKAAVMVSSDEISWREFHEIEADFLFRNYSPDDAFTKLRLKEAGDKLFDKSLFRFWTKYVIYYNSWVKQEADKVSMLSVLEKHFDQLALLDQIKLKQNSDITKHLMEELKDIKMVDLAKAAVKVSNDETSRREFHAIEADFLFRKYSPDDAFTKLRLKKAGDKLFDNRLFHFWTKYVIYYNSWVKQEADKVSMLSVLEKHFDLLTLLDQIKLHHNSDLPKHLMEEIKDAGIEDLII